MTLIDRYTAEIGKRLPRKTRADIETEIRSTLQDMLDDRSQKAGRPVDEVMVSEVLTEYGAPAKVAATYLPERSLIGPRLYPIFTLVIKAVVTVLSVLSLVGLGIALGTSTAGLAGVAKTIGMAFSQYIEGLIIALGFITLIFSIIERSLPESELEHIKMSEPAWDPADLMKEPDPETIKLWEPIMAVLFTCAALIIFNFYPQIIAITPSLNNPGNGAVVFVPLLSDAFFRYLPWLNVLWVLQIVLNLLLLRLGHWNLPTRLVSIGLKACGIGIANAMLRGPSLISTNLTIPVGEVLGVILTQVVRLALLIAIIAGCIEVVRDVYRLITKGWDKKMAIAQ